MTVHELLADLRKQGFQLTPLPGDRLEVRPFSKLPEELRAALRHSKAEVLALLTQQQATPWPCRHCGNPAEIEAVEPSLDGQRMLTFWNCQRCQVWAVTLDTLRQPPVWVSRKEQ